VLVLATEKDCKMAKKAAAKKSPAKTKPAAKPATKGKR